MWNCGSAECLRTWCPEVGVVNALSVKRSSADDGTVGCYEVPLNSKTAKIEFSGADCDPIYDISAIAEGRQLYTACRDRIVRRYTLE
uniref:Uncharacterized protein n=1 Tax=Parascaris equorum TaxID=6256 RepID=A0A914RY66_PAREQ